MRPQATSVCGRKLLVYASVCGLEVLVCAALFLKILAFTLFILSQKIRIVHRYNRVLDVELKLVNAARTFGIYICI